MVVLLRGGGDLATGIAYRLARVGIKVVICELPAPLAVRRLVSFSDAVYEGTLTVEGITAVRTELTEQAIDKSLNQDTIPVIIDPHAQARFFLQPKVLIDARMLKQPPETSLDTALFTIGVGPGFTAGLNCQAAVETNRGPFLGRVIWLGSPQDDTKKPEAIGVYGVERVIRSPARGVLRTSVNICEHVEAGQWLASVEDQAVRAPFTGVVRGFLRPGTVVEMGMKIGDIDPRDDVDLCRRISDKALAVAGGVLEAILTRQELRKQLWA
jgi:xanthine dehydrogenase accessory factor